MFRPRKEQLEKQTMAGQFHSKKCWGAYISRRESKVCEECGASYRPPTKASSTARWCSRACWRKSDTRKMPRVTVYRLCGAMLSRAEMAEIAGVKTACIASRLYKSGIRPGDDVPPSIVMPANRGQRW
jgi:hypothetical protein